MLHSPLPWKIESVNQFEQSIRDSSNHNVQMLRGTLDLSGLNAEFVVNAVNSFEANQAEIEQLKEQLGKAKEGLQQAGWNATRLGCDCTNRPNQAIVCERCRIKIAVDKALSAIE
jgi:uncharacterized paraquat-inducible protein A